MALLVCAYWGDGGQRGGDGVGGGGRRAGMGWGGGMRMAGMGWGVRRTGIGGRYGGGMEGRYGARC